jgi:hypothetical protein
MKPLLWLFLAIGLVYGFYSGAVAVYEYMQVKDVVEESVQERSRLDRYERPGRVKDDILRKSSAAGINLEERDVMVTEENSVLRVLIRWTRPVIVYNNEAYVSIPISYDRSFNPGGAR